MIGNFAVPRAAAALCILLVMGLESAWSASNLGFGVASTFQTDDNCQLGVSPDTRAFTLSCSNFQAVVGSTGTPAPIATRVYSLVLPLKGDGYGGEIEFALQGFVITTEGATATLIFSVNGHNTVVDFPANSEKSFTHQFKYSVGSESESRLNVFLLAERGSNGSDAHIHVQSIDAEVLPRSR